MHDDRVICICINAFHGFGDTTGSDNFGISVAWIDLDDHLEPDGLNNYELYPYSDDVSAYVKTHPHVGGKRYALAYWHADGRREVLGFDSKAEALTVFQSFADEFDAWEGDADA